MVFINTNFSKFFYFNNIEQGIAPDGSKVDPNSHDKGLETFFSESDNGHFVPRAIMADLEPTVIDQIRTGI